MGRIEEKKVSEMRKKAVIDTFFATFRKMKKGNPDISIGDVLKEAVKASAPRFYISYENARRFISLLARKKHLPIANNNKIAMYKELYKRYMERIKDKCNSYTILESIIEEPAPSFYIDEGTFRGLLYKAIRERRKSPVTNLC